MEREAQTSDGVKDENYPLPFPRCGNGGSRADPVLAHGRSTFSRGRDISVDLELGDGAHDDIGGQPLPPLLAASDAGAAVPFPLPAIFSRWRGGSWESTKQIFERLS